MLAVLAFPKAITLDGGREMVGFSFSFTADSPNERTLELDYARVVQSRSDLRDVRADFRARLDDGPWQQHSLGLGNMSVELEPGVTVEIHPEFA